jgi:uncharacterized SAM-binding protein YcdF (DUF218 family)
VDIAADVVKAFWLPGSLSFFLVGISLGALLLLVGRRARAWGTGLIVGLVVIYWLLSVPLVSDGLTWLLAGGYGRVESADQAEGVRAIVILGGGSETYRAEGLAVDVLGQESADRVLEAARLYSLLGRPWVIASGGPGGDTGQGTPESQVLQDALVRCGVPSERILQESTSENTHDEAVALAKMLQDRHLEQFVLVTSAVHMPRAVGSMRAQGLDPIPSVALPAAPGPRSRLLPSLSALNSSRLALREALALVYYAARGWLRATPSPTSMPSVAPVSADTATNVSLNR